MGNNSLALFGSDINKLFSEVKILTEQIFQYDFYCQNANAYFVLQ